MVSIPLRDRIGEVIAHALVDDGDEHLAKVRWYRHRSGYVVRTTRIKGKYRQKMLHREIVGVASGDEREVDHINRDRLDNRRENLRVLTAAQNRQNVGSMAGSSSQYRGVSWDVRLEKWRASVRGRQIGTFDDERDAAEAARAHRIEHMPFSNEVAS